MVAVLMKRVDPLINMAKYYEMDVQPTLFGEFVVQRHWGRIGTSGQSKVFWFDNEEDAQRMATRITHTKTAKGYQVSA